MASVTIKYKTITIMASLTTSVHYHSVPWGAPQGGPGGPWPTQFLELMGHNVFGPPKKSTETNNRATV